LAKVTRDDRGILSVSGGGDARAGSKSTLTITANISGKIKAAPTEQIASGVVTLTPADSRVGSQTISVTVKIAAAPPKLDVQPSEIKINIPTGQTSGTGSMTVTNAASPNVDTLLTYTLPPGTGVVVINQSGTAVGKLTVGGQPGSLTSGQAKAHTVSVTGTFVDGQTYTALISIESNDPDHPKVQVPVTITVGNAVKTFVGREASLGSQVTVNASFNPSTGILQVSLSGSDFNGSMKTESFSGSWSILMARTSAVTIWQERNGSSSFTGTVSMTGSDPFGKPFSGSGPIKGTHATLEFNPDGSIKELGVDGLYVDGQAFGKFFR